MDIVLSKIAGTVRDWMILPARVLHKLSGGRIKPDHITAVSVLGHLVIFWALALGTAPAPRLGALFLIVFGLMDSLDGALARLQSSASIRGMFHDAAGDRLKEVILYTALAIFITNHPDYHQNNVVLVVAALGLSQLVSYIKAKGEMAIAIDSKANPQSLNRLFGSGIARYEVRMFLVVLGLTFPLLPQVLCVIIALTLTTAVQRFIQISYYVKKLGK